jgi:hypothetical protein
MDNLPEPADGRTGEGTDPMKKSRHNFVVAALLAGLIFPVLATSAGETRIYYLGNSLTDELKYDDFVELAAAGGEKIVWGRHMIPGCPIRGLWGATSGFEKAPFGHWQKALREFEWDVVTLQPFCPFPGEYEHATLFARETVKKSPDARIYVYAQWPDKNRGSDWDRAFARPAEQSRWANSEKKPEFSYDHVVATAVPPGVRDGYTSNSLRNDYEVMVYGLRKNVQSRKPAMLIPAGHVMQLLGQKMRAGRVPGYRTPWDFYTDGVHVNNDGSYLVACTFYATIFQKSPVGLPVGNYQGQPGYRGDSVKITPELARMIQETVWEVVASHPLSGVTAEEPLKVVTPILDEPVAGEPFHYELLSAFGKGPCRWEVANGALPQGLRLSSDGVISGTPAKSGQAHVRFRVADSSGAKAAKSFDMRVAEDVQPTIPEQAIPARSAGEYFAYRLKSEGGNGTHKWTLPQGSTLPGGMVLSPDGRLSGALGKAGTYTFVAMVADGDAGNPETDERVFTLNVGPATTELATARRLREKMELCHWQKEPDPSPWKFRYPIEKLVQGDKATVSGAFDLAWDDEHLWVAVKVKDATNTPGSRGDKFGGDNTVLCIDGLNNREATYNADDRYLAFARKCPWPTGAYIGDRFTAACRHKDLEDGYFVLYRVSFRNLGLVGPESLLNRVIGLDVVLVDDARNGVPKSMVVWKGTRDNRSDPSKFGAVVLSDPDAGK